MWSGYGTSTHPSYDTTSAIQACTDKCYQLSVINYQLSVISHHQHGIVPHSLVTTCMVVFGHKLCGHHLGLCHVFLKRARARRKILDTSLSLFYTKFLSVEHMFFLRYFSSKDTFCKKMFGKLRNWGGNAWWLERCRSGPFWHQKDLRSRWQKILP